LNVRNDQRGKVGYTTYLVLIALQCIGFPLAFLISSPQKVIRPDGTRLRDPTKNKKVSEELKKMWILFKSKKILLLLPILIGFNWNTTYQGIYLTKYFSVRSRALGSLMSGVGATAGDVFWGWFLDRKFTTRPMMAKVTWLSFATIMFGLFSWQVANEHLYANTVPKVTLDWDTPGFGRAFAVNVLFRFMNESHYVFVYWLIGTFDNDIETLTLTVGILRSMESIGSCLSFGIGAAKIPAMTNLIISFVMFAVAVPTTSYVTFLVPERPSELAKVESSDEEDETREKGVDLGVQAVAEAADIKSG
jgi:hypothetical protein